LATCGWTHSPVECIPLQCPVGLLGGEPILFGRADWAPPVDPVDERKPLNLGVFSWESVVIYGAAPLG